jgi:hypothetical protein
MGFAQDEAPYCPGETGNNPFERSKYALSHICECAQPPPSLVRKAATSLELCWLAVECRLHRLGRGLNCPKLSSV